MLELRCKPTSRDVSCYLSHLIEHELLPLPSDVMMLWDIYHIFSLPQTLTLSIVLFEQPFIFKVEDRDIWILRIDYGIWFEFQPKRTTFNFSTPGTLMTIVDRVRVDGRCPMTAVNIPTPI